MQKYNKFIKINNLDLKILNIKSLSNIFSQILYFNTFNQKRMR